MNPIEIAVSAALLAVSVVVSVEPSDVPAPPVETAQQAPVASGEALTWQQVHDIALAVSGSARWAAKAADVAMCESSGEWWQRRGGNGTSHGLFSVKPEYWGTVPAEAWGQVEQTFRIWVSQGGDARGPWWPWTCA